MINLDGIKNIFFDLGGVLINLDRERCVNEFQKLGLQEIDEQIGHSFKSGLFLRLEEGTITPDGFRNEIRRMTDRQLTDNEIDSAWNSFLVDIPYSKLELLLKLRKHYRVFMLSNTNKIHFDYMKSNAFSANAGFSIDDYFEKCYLSYELHLSKPDKEIFEAIIEDSEILPQESLFLDDNRQNIECARELGFCTYFVTENEDFTGKFSISDKVMSDK
jgi:putative hydrolase of the HAD superfamily